MNELLPAGGKRTTVAAAGPAANASAVAPKRRLRMLPSSCAKAGAPRLRPLTPPDWVEASSRGGCLPFTEWPSRMADPVAPPPIKAKIGVGGDADASAMAGPSDRDHSPGRADVLRLPGVGRRPAGRRARDRARLHPQLRVGFARPPRLPGA